MMLSKPMYFSKVYIPMGNVMCSPQELFSFAQPCPRLGVILKWVLQMLRKEDRGFGSLIPCSHEDPGMRITWGFLVRCWLASSSSAALLSRTARVNGILRRQELSVGISPQRSDWPPSSQTLSQPNMILALALGNFPFVRGDIPNGTSVLFSLTGQPTLTPFFLMPLYRTSAVSQLKSDVKATQVWACAMNLCHTTREQALSCLASPCSSPSPVLQRAARPKPSTCRAFRHTLSYAWKKQPTYSKLRINTAITKHRQKAGRFFPVRVSCPSPVHNQAALHSPQAHSTVAQLNYECAGCKGY